MKIAVMGAGAVGCYFGAMLARAGNLVTLIGRSQHVEAVRRHGLLLEHRDFRDHVQVSATTDAVGVVDADIVLFCVKSADTGSWRAPDRPALEARCCGLVLAKRRR